MAKRRFTASAIIRHALVWGEENIEAMMGGIEGVAGEEAHREELSDLLRAMRAYRIKRFGKRHDPLEGVSKIDAYTRKPIQ